jgi:hypothetical protein
MRSKELNLDNYDSDKIINRYTDRYDIVFKSLISKPITLLELGVYKGGSLLLWRDYFPSGTIVGIDCTLPKNFNCGERIHVFEGSQTDTQFLSSVANKIAPEGFDIIIDDASHIGELSKISFWHLFDNHLKPGGLYVIEDWGTGYWDDWSDGKSLDPTTYDHPKPEKITLWQKIIGKKKADKTPFPCHSYGMDGFVKQLIDEQAAYAVSMKNLIGKPQRKSKFKEMLITPCIVFVTKTDPEHDSRPCPT